MVPLNDDALARSFGAQLAELHHDMLVSWRAEAPEAGLVEWAAIQSNIRLEIDVPPLMVAKLPAQRWSEAPVLAAVGFRLPLPGTGDEAAELWLDGMRRLMTRDAVPIDRNSFFFRPVELLGLAAGARTLAEKDDAPRRWLRDLLGAHGDLLPRSGVWSVALGALAAWCVGARWEMASRLDPRTAVDIAALLWLHLVDEDLASATTSVDRESLSRQLLERASTTHVQPHGLGEQGVLGIALQRAVAAAIGDLQLGGLRTANFVVQLCRRFPLLVGQLSNRYSGRPTFDINDEYDVQDLLRGTLQLHFDDVRPEEWNPSYGGVQSRSDLLLKPERLVIETKMTRKGLGQRELVQQLIVDKAQYRGHPDCGTLVCFVYDPNHRLPNPTAIERDLSDRVGGLATVAVVSPRGL